jgi:flagellar motor protein MotB
MSYRPFATSSLLAFGLAFSTASSWGAEATTSASVKASASAKTSARVGRATSFRDGKADEAKTTRDRSSQELSQAKQTESQAKQEVAQKEVESKEAEDSVQETTKEVAEVDQALTEKPSAQEVEDVVVTPPPTTPADNAFGYETPVWGCFEGNVMFIEANSQKLPTDYSKYAVSSRLYACEWNIPARSFDEGFPGVTDRFEWFAIVYSGMFSVSAPGTYQFRINSDDGTKLFIDGKPVVVNDGAHPPASVSGSVELTPGDHELSLEYFQGPRYEIALQVWVTPPGGTEQVFSVR